jgi:hypothetical protein
MNLSRSKRKPNLFIAGAPKCGTTAMYTYLKQHPKIYMAPRKEPQYFGADFDKRPLNSYNHIGDKDTYQLLFAGAKDEIYIGEASTSYFFSTSAAQEIHAFNPQAKILIMLRNPIEMAYALYYQQRKTGIEDLPTFEEALAAEPSRREGNRLTSRTYIAESLCYSYIASYYEHVVRYVDVFGWDNLKIILFDDFKDDVEIVYRDVLTFLGLEFDHRQDFAIINKNGEPRNIILRNFLANPPESVLIAGRFLLPIARPIYRFLRLLNTQASERPHMNPDTEKQLCTTLRADVQRIENLLERDLSHWCQPPD